MTNISRLEPPRFLGTLEQVKNWLNQAYRRFAQFERGSFTATLTGFTTTVTGTVDYTIIGDVVTLSVATNITGTSNATTMTMTGLPADLRPAANISAIARVADSGTSLFGLAVVGSSGTITFYYGPTSSSAFTNTGTKGVTTCTMVYKR